MIDFCQAAFTSKRLTGIREWDDGHVERFPSHAHQQVLLPTPGAVPLRDGFGGSLLGILSRSDMPIADNGYHNLLPPGLVFAWHGFMPANLVQTYSTDASQRRELYADVKFSHPASGAK